jgi:hypothetical protein
VRRVRPYERVRVEICPVCGQAFDPSGYHVAIAGIRYDSIDCALRARAMAAGRKADATDEWVEAAKKRLGVEPQK